MAHDRHAALNQEGDGLRHAPAAFEFDRAAAGFLEHARRRGERLFLRGLVGAERQVDDDQRALRAAHHREPLQDHHLECDRHGGLEPMHHHAERIADQNEVAITVEDARRVRMIGGEALDRRAALAGADARRGQPPDLVVHRHR
jgi:hypothetical protein